MKYELLLLTYSVTYNWQIMIVPTNWRYVALVVVLWCPVLSLLAASVTALRWEPLNVHV